MARKLSPGIHERVKVGNTYRRVKVNAKGQWRFLKGPGTRSKPSKPSKSRSRSKTANPNKGKGGGKKILGTIGWKGALASIASLAVLRIAIRRMFGQVPAEYVDSASMVGAGIVGKATKIGTAHLLAPGVVLGVSKLIEDLVSPGGAYTYPGIGNGGYDY